MNDDDDDVRKLRGAIYNNDIALASTLIASIAGSAAVNCQPSLLLRAAERNRVEIMRMLLDAGADIDAMDAKRQTASHAAIRRSHFAALQLLVERGADVRQIRSRDESLIKAVSHYSDDRMACLLLNAGAPLDNLTRVDLVNLVAKSKSVAVIAHLLARKVDVSALRDASGRTLCHFVVWTPERGAEIETVLRALVDAGVNVNAANIDGLTPLHYAATMRNATALRILVELGADIDRQMPTTGRTALHEVCGSWRHETMCVELLLALGADVHALNNQGQTPCQVAARLQCADAVCAFFAAGCELQLHHALNACRLPIHQSLFVQVPATDEVEAARRRIARTRLDLVRYRALSICVGLQPLGLDALQLCEIMMHAFGALGSLIVFHQWWNIAITIKHFHSNR